MTNSKTNVFSTISTYFGDTILMADEYISEGRLEPKDVIECFVSALVENEKYFTDKAKIYDDIYYAISQRSRNR